eukprot:TRINITY_DN1573_c0_g1_i3.p1 TRINITY_DN1573_c0_g1~~TRINITY_DN1573_c0_g1_i3.p1  ORF type:complete len:582 (+),score=63.56 TRINITY_DN1573_c0_g1_i3:233-1978(+)
MEGYGSKVSFCSQRVISKLTQIETPTSVKEQVPVGLYWKLLEEQSNEQQHDVIANILREVQVMAKPMRAEEPVVSEEVSAVPRPLTARTKRNMVVYSAGGPWVFGKHSKALEQSQLSKHVSSEEATANVAAHWHENTSIFGELQHDARPGEKCPVCGTYCQLPIMQALEKAEDTIAAFPYQEMLAEWRARMLAEQQGLSDPSGEALLDEQLRQPQFDSEIAAERARLLADLQATRFSGQTSQRSGDERERLLNEIYQPIAPGPLQQQPVKRKQAPKRIWMPKTTLLSYDELVMLSDHAPIPEPQQIADLWARLKMPRAQRAQMLAKYSTPIFAPLFALACQSWAAASQAIEAREAILGQFARFESERLSLKSWNPIEVEAARMAILKQLNDSDSQCRVAVADVRRNCGDIVTYQGESYLHRMDTDVHRLLAVAKARPRYGLTLPMPRTDEISTLAQLNRSIVVPTPRAPPPSPLRASRMTPRSSTSQQHDGVDVSLKVAMLRLAVCCEAQNLSKVRLREVLVLPLQKRLCCVFAQPATGSCFNRSCHYTRSYICTFEHQTALKTGNVLYFESSSTFRVSFL